MKKFINLNQLKLEKGSMEKIIGGGNFEKPPRPMPLYGIKPPPVVRYAIVPQPLYSITPAK